MDLKHRCTACKHGRHSWCRDVTCECDHREEEDQ